MVKLGDIVLYTPPNHQRRAGYAERMAAIVTHRHDDGSVNLTIFDSQGFTESRAHVVAREDGGHPDSDFWQPKE